MAIQYVTYEQVDRQRWDACIQSASNGLIYASSSYLDAMATHWDALVLDDYAAVMPLTWRKKYGIYYLYQPFFTACLGVFAKEVTAGLLNDFLKSIPAKFKYWDIYLNHGNFFRLEEYALYERMNYVLPLDKSYEALYAAFRDNVKRNIKKAEKLQCVVKTGFSVDDVIAVAEEQARQFSSASADDYIRFKKLYKQLYNRQQAITYGVYAASGGLLASAVFFFFGNRAYYILVGNHPNGKTLGASHALINAFVKDHAGREILLDFEGSDIHNLAFFYSSFGAQQEKYAGLKYNNLPALLKIFKK